MMNLRRTLIRADALRRIRRRRALLGLSLATAAVVCLAACGSSAGGGGGSTGGASASSGATATVKVSKLPGYSSVLTTSSGQAVYLLTADPSGGSSCNSSCTAQWPPVESKSLKAGPGVKTALLSTFKRSDGQEQVMYNHHALYTHKGTGAASGAGVAADGGIWYLVSPSGSAVKSTSSGGY
jgi:predicted lipoprotein with Yx(FWY)xxD motif